MNERFTDLVETDCVSAESISASILAHLCRIGVDSQKFVGHGFDGNGKSCKQCANTHSR